MGVQQGRYRADFPEGTVVFLIGMRINAFWWFRSWWPVFMAMPKMLRELATHPELGLLEARNEIGWRRATVVQYWESMDKLMAYAAARDHAHLPAWKAFNREAKRSGPVVGIWHEAYAVDPARTHVVYQNMPPFGLGKATAWKPVNGMPPQPVRSRLDAGAASSEV